MADIQRREYARLLVVPIAFALATLFLWCLFSYRPPLKNGHTPDLHFPKSLEDLRELVRVSSAYKTDHWYYVLLLFSSAYIYKQTFAIPGSALLNLLGGALFGSWPLGFPLCCVLTAIGASNCFLLSRLVGKALVQKKLASKIQWLQEKIHENENQLFLFLISLRVFPMTPNWLLNVSAPYVNVPLPIFSLSVFFGGMYTLGKLLNSNPSTYIELMWLCKIGVLTFNCIFPQILTFSMLYSVCNGRTRYFKMFIILSCVTF
ncbi:transmembrane protein 41A-like isoform X1 [Macrobrachium nipponense]|uniref:transmembrane protein 41A-like isoform X1 n=1 Tax=Macrobrachium nipponense TaxID=159736 RepID=UPI0030C7C0A4